MLQRFQSMLPWTDEAVKAVERVPFFVRNRVKAKIEAEAAARGCSRVTLQEVEDTRKRFLSGMHEDVQGYRIETCFGEGGCPNRVLDGSHLAARLRETLESADLRSFLRTRLGDRLKYHHEFRVALADCPNACSQPQIRDIGIIAGVEPRIGSSECTRCGACGAACIEGAIEDGASSGCPRVDPVRCVRCGQCIAVCPTQTITRGASGWRVLLGGKLGRHPRLAEALPGLYDEEAVVRIVLVGVAHFMRHFEPHRRFADMLPMDIPPV
ncbi:MAG: 4Fe-4S binding protein [Thermodesulfobacteriota bacterium]